MKKVAFIFIFISISLTAQDYVEPKDQLVVEKLKQWQDLKFGIIIHFGLYSEAGVVESWNLCSEEEDWIPRDSTISYETYKQNYKDIRLRFNPTLFDAENWAKQAQNAGMKYIIFTTKHHDGFALYDTKFSNFKVTQQDVPYSEQPHPDIFRSITNAFRKKNFMIGAYFSKPDWNSDFYWWKKYATPNRYHNYSIDKNPERWHNFKEFTYNQINEITSNYGKIDILWLDGGWVRPTTKEEFNCNRIYKGSEDLDIAKIVEKVRQNQPGIIVVDRDVHGENENYRTPEQKIPNNLLPYPWETCMTLGKDWGFTPNDEYKSAETIIKNLVKIVSHGGNLLLGIGPKGDGTFPTEVSIRLQEIGNWMNINGESIYETKPVSIQTEKQLYTQKNNTTYAFVFPEEVGKQTLQLNNIHKKPNKITLLGFHSKITFSYDKEKKSIALQIPKEVRKSLHTIVFKIEE